MNKQATLLVPCLLTGGTEVATLDTAKALAELGFFVTVLVYFDETDRVMLSTFQRAGIKVIVLGLARDGGAAGKLLMVRALVRYLSRQSPTLVWVQYMTPTLIPVLVARFFTRRLIAAVHVAARHYSSGGLRRLRWLATWWCDRLVCVSHTTAKGILGEKPSARLGRHVCVIPNALDVQVAERAIPRNWREELCLDAKVPLIGFVGRLAQNKGADVLLKAAELVNRRYPDTHWVVVGEGAEKSALQQLAAETGLTGRIHFVGILPREGVYAAMKGFDIAVVPSREEGFGLTALEAMGCGLPLVASRVDALQEVVIEEKTGLLFPVEDVNALAASLNKLLASPSLSNTISTAALAHAETNYGRLQLTERMRRLLDDLDEAALRD